MINYRFGGTKVTDYHLEESNNYHEDFCWGCGNRQKVYRVVMLQARPVGTLCSECVKVVNGPDFLGWCVQSVARNDLGALCDAYTGSEQDKLDLMRLYYQLDFGLALSTMNHHQWYKIRGESTPDKWTEDPATQKQRAYIDRLLERTNDEMADYVRGQTGYDGSALCPLSKGLAGIMIKVLLGELPVERLKSDSVEVRA